MYDEGQSTQENKSVNRRKLYLTIASILLFILSIVWSIDSSLIYILSGSAFYFFYLAVRQRDRTFIYDRIEHLDAGQESNDVRERVITRTENIFEKQPIQDPPIKSTASRFRITLVRLAALAFSFICFEILFTQFFPDNQQDSDSYYQRAYSFYNEANYDSASIYFRRALQAERDNSNALLGYGNTLMMNGQYDSAILLYDRALIVNPEFEQALYQKGLVLYYQKNYDESKKVLNTLLELNPSYYEAQQTIGDGLYNEQHYDSALLWYNHAYTGGLRNRYLCHLMAYIYDEKGKTDKAIELYKEALTYDDSIVDIYVRLGELLPGEAGIAYRNKAQELLKSKQ